MPHGTPPATLELWESYKKKLTIINDVDKRGGKGKNKGRKKKERAKNFAEANREHRNTDIMGGNYKVGYIGNFLIDILPKGVIKRTTYSNTYILCPYHKERTASMCISKKNAVVKCYSCGKAHRLSTFLSMTLGKSRDYRQEEIEAANSGTYKPIGNLKKEARPRDNEYDEEEDR